MSNFQSILDAVDKYAEQTGINLKENPFAEKVKNCDSPSAVLDLLQDNLKAFKDFRDKNRKFIECISPVLQFVHAFSGVLGEAAGLIPFQPAKLIFAGIDVLFAAADGVSASYDALLELFECIGNFLRRLHIYSEIPLDILMEDMVAKIMVELISILALAKKQIGRGRLKRFAKKLLGDSEIETILKRLDRLTQDEARMTVAQTLAIVHGLLDNMKVVMDGGEASTSTIRRTLATMQEVANGINKMKRDQMQKDARSWISPPDPSKNHVIARRIHSGKSAVWFTQGHNFKNWDLTGGLLWIHGKPGSGKSILCSNIIEQATTLCNEGLGLVSYYYFDFRDAAKQDVRGLLSSLVVQLCAMSDSCYDILSDLYSRHNAGLRLPADDSLTQCLKDMLGLPGLPPIHIIIDALDECPDTSGPPSPRELVLDLVEELVKSDLPNLRICVLSRPEVDIEEALGSLASYSVSLHDEDGQKKDIMDYISSTVQSDRKMRKWRAEDRQSVIDALTQRADGMYVVVIESQLFFMSSQVPMGLLPDRGVAWLFPPDITARPRRVA
ncbi:hypothetical protein EI94DRAFT_910452 [Lactarius quietus]|nr:hypothetical protein EI94DRAFT_910452 [Lactarius quietus]